MADSEPGVAVVELRVSYRYAKDHPWVVQALTGFLSAYFMEQPGFRVRRQFEDLASGAHVWLCETPASMKMPVLLRRLQADIPPFRATASTDESGHQQYVIASPDQP